MTLRQVQRLLEENHELGVSYMSVHRYVRSHIQPLERPVTVRLHPPAGEQAQVDFGYAGLMRDLESGKLRRAWAFILILSHSRHRFVRFVFRQDNRTWLDCHIRALKFFGGCPTLIVLDNLKNGVLRPDLYDPTLNPAYAELERHYGFVADPAKVAMARHKGKVERCVPVVRQQLLAGREFRDIDEANQRALQWCLQEVGLREHGTTHRKPYEVFLAEEAPELLPLPEQPYEAPEWQECTVHRDCHLILDKCYYSVPYPYRGEKLWVRADLKLLRVYRDHQLIKTHVRVFEPGTWQTDEADYPPEKRAYLEQTPAYCRAQAQPLGPEVSRYMERILADHAMRNVRKAQAVLRLGQRYGATALDQACGRALSFDNLRLASLKEILEKGVHPVNGEVPPVKGRPWKLPHYANRGKTSSSRGELASARSCFSTVRTALGKLRITGLLARFDVARSFPQFPRPLLLQPTIWTSERGADLGSGRCQPRPHLPIYRMTRKRAVATTRDPDPALEPGPRGLSFRPTP